MKGRTSPSWAIPAVLGALAAGGGYACDAQIGTTTDSDKDEVVGESTTDASRGDPARLQPPVDSAASGVGMTADARPSTTADAPDTSAGMQPGSSGRTLAVGAFSSCLVDDAGGVHCFGRCGPVGKGGARNQAPAGLKARTVVVARTFACALLAQPVEGTTIRCWGGGLASGAIPSVADAVEIVAGDSHACVRTGAGAVTCWGAAEHKAPEGLKAKALAASSAMTCAIAADDLIRCWGSHAAPPPPDLKVRRLAVASQPSDPRTGKRLGCAITLGGEVLCWGDDSGGVQAVPAGLKAREIAVGGSFACAITMGGQVTCWGSPPRFGKKLPGQLEARALAIGFRTAAAVLPDGAISFWGDVTDARGEPPAGVKAAP